MCTNMAAINFVTSRENDLYAIMHKIPLERKHARDSLRRCYDCGAITHKDERTSKITFYPPSDEEEDDLFAAIRTLLCT